jgi:hypothetical protein
MKKTSLLALIATIAGIGAATATTPYANSSNPSEGDLFLGVYQSTSTPNSASAFSVLGGSYNALVFDVGSVGNFASINVNVNDALSAAYGANWSSLGNLNYAAFGFSSDYSQLYVTKADPQTGNVSKKSAGAVGVPISNYQTFIGQLKTDVVNSSTLDGAILQGAGDSYNFVTQGLPETSIFGTGVAGTAVFSGALDLNRINIGTGQAGTNVGVITLGADGSVSAVPEPSTYALLGLGALLLVIAYRRKTA